MDHLSLFLRVFVDAARWKFLLMSVSSLSLGHGRVKASPDRCMDKIICNIEWACDKMKCYKNFSSRSDIFRVRFRGKKSFLLYKDCRVTKRYWDWSFFEGKKESSIN